VDKSAGGEGRVDDLPHQPRVVWRLLLPPQTGDVGADAAHGGRAGGRAVVVLLVFSVGIQQPISFFLLVDARTLPVFVPHTYS